MAHGRIEDKVISANMNALVFSIKVERKKRPGIDTIYQSALAIIREQGVWP